MTSTFLGGWEADSWSDFVLLSGVVFCILRELIFSHLAEAMSLQGSPLGIPDNRSELVGE